jgi:hypothetical protein
MIEGGKITPKKISTAKRFRHITEEEAMKDYENLINVLDRHFGNIIVMYR